MNISASTQFSAIFVNAIQLIRSLRMIFDGGRYLVLFSTGMQVLAPLLQGAALPEVRHEPQQPKSGAIVLITADFSKIPPADDLTVQYQVVDPGKYIALDEPAYKTEWTSIAMNDNGEKGDRVKGDGIFSALLTSELQRHRRLIRYRICAGKAKKPIAPDMSDPQPNFAYFVYDGTPTWKGAINPKASESKLRQPTLFSSEVLDQVPVYHFISHKASVEKVTWFEPTHFGSPTRNEYKHVGTMVYDGIVYDHVKFRARGGMWRHSMGKNMWKFNFLAGHRFRARDAYGRPYEAKWDKLNLGACIQQGDYGMRGEQGMFEALGFRLFNLAGVAAPRTHWIHLRIIDQPEESPSDQYAGDFWGLYLATENIDEQFLKEHHLPPGNVYKIEAGAKLEFNGDPTVTNKSDVIQFMRSIGRQPDPWWNQNVDLASYYNYRSIMECIHHYDVDAGKNYFYYRNPVSKKWSVLPWDIDLTWSDQMFGGGHEPFFRSGLLTRPPFKEQYQQRLAEIRDLLFNQEQIGLLIDEHAAMISNPKGGPSLAAADRAKWDYHPMLLSGQAHGSKAGHGRFYFGNPGNDFQIMVKYMKDYARKRMAWIDRTLLRDYRPPPPPKIELTPSSKSANAPLFEVTSDSSHDATKSVQWRLAEVTVPDSATFQVRQPCKYELVPLIEKELGAKERFETPANSLVAGRVYRIRARSQDENGRWSRWSSPVQITAGVK
jgi:hypothetical protein